MIWPWLEKHYNYAMGVEDRQPMHPTACQFLQYLMRLRVIILQDVAAMMVECETQLEIDPEDMTAKRRLDHAVFRLRVFQSEQFDELKQAMKEKLVEAEREDNDPNKMCIERALPGVNRQFASVRAELQALNAKMEQMQGQEQCLRNYIEDEFTDVHELVQKTVESFKQGQTHLLGQIGKVFSAVASASADGARTGPGGTTSKFLSAYANSSSEDNTGYEANDDDDEEAEAVAEGEGEGEDALSEEVQVDDEHLEQLAGSAGEEDTEFNRIQHVRMRAFDAPKLVLKELYKEYYGLEEYAGIPIEGGFNGLELKYKAKWRRNWAGRCLGKRFNRISKIVKAVHQSERTDAFFEMYQEKLNTGLSTLECQMKKDGMIESGKPRKKRSGSNGDGNGNEE